MTEFVSSVARIAHGNFGQLADGSMENFGTGEHLAKGYFQVL